MKFKVGDKCIVKAMKYGHRFQIGQIVTVTACRSATNDYRMESSDNCWYMRDNELKLAKDAKQHNK